jgi:hypothetical protein
VTVVPIPRSVLQLVTMGSLGLAFVLALLLNPRLLVRPSAFLLLLSLLAVVSIVSSSMLDSGVGALVRSVRQAVFIATLWLLSRWWDGSVTFARLHVRALTVPLVSVIIGLVVAPSLARPADFDNRLIGVVWPIAATQVADYAAVVAGLALVLWLIRIISGRNAAVIAIPAVVVLGLTHTRTATVGLGVALVVVVLTLTLSNSRARRTLTAVVLAAVVTAVAFAGPVLTWFRRGQDEDALSNLTGRQKVWDMLLAEPRTPHERLFGVGLTNKSFGGLPIDSTWLTVYYEQGLLGVALVVMIAVVLIFAAAMRPPSAARTCAVFLLVYGLVASYTQTGLGDVSGYLLHFSVAAALLTPVAIQDRAGSRRTPKARKPTGTTARWSSSRADRRADDGHVDA